MLGNPGYCTGASALASYDLGAAREALSSKSGKALPADMQAAFGTITVCPNETGG